MYKLLAILSCVTLVTALLDSAPLKDWQYGFQKPVIELVSRQIHETILPSYQDALIRQLLKPLEYEMENQFIQEWAAIMTRSDFTSECLELECQDLAFSEAAMKAMSSSHRELFDHTDSVLLHHALAAIPSHVRSHRHRKPLRRKRGLDSLAAIPDVDLDSLTPELPIEKRANFDAASIRASLRLIVEGAKKSVLVKSCGRGNLTCRITSKKPAVSIV